MAKMQIIRWENNEGTGCYSPRAYFKKDNGLTGHYYHRFDLASSKRHPPPRYDEGLEHFGEYGMVQDEDDYFCGFVSREQALAWFSSEAGRKALAKRGFLPMVYEVNPEWVIQGHAQCVFKRPEAKMVSTLDPVTLAAVS